MTKDQAMKLALDALTSGVDVQMGRVVWTEYDSGLIAKAVTALTERLAQPEQEPVKFNCTVVDDAHPEGVPLSQWGKQQKQKPFCYHDGRNIVGKEYADHSDVFPLYTRPQAREPLTDEQIIGLWQDTKEPDGHRIERFVRAIESAHGITGEKK
jgi:hypothetical protein